MARHEHVVQLYGSDDHELTRNVARFLTEGFARGEGLLLIATPCHTDAIVSGLAERGIDVPRVVRNGQLVALDAESLLGQLSADGMPDAARFDAVMGEILRSIRTRSGSETVCAYGEMVGLLWTAGSFAAAERLEQLWSTVLDAGGLRLFCAYAIDVLGRGCNPAGLASVLAAHSDVIPSSRNLQSALSRAMREVLGEDAERVQRRLMERLQLETATAESLAAGLLAEQDDPSREILDRARYYHDFRPSAA